MEPIGLEPTTSCMPYKAHVAESGPDGIANADAATGVTDSVTTGMQERGSDADLSRLIAAWPTLPDPVPFHLSAELQVVAR